MINKSFQLLRTDPLLTSNFKVVVTSDYKLYMESFNTNNALSNIDYKHFAMYKTDYLEDKIPYFYKKMPIDTAFDVRYEGDNKTIQNTYDKQYDSIYFAGGGYVEDQWYTEEFDYLAPLYVRKNQLPEGFIILRVDEPSGYNLNVNEYYELNSLTSDNFHEIVDNWKCIKYFDMTYTSDLGTWLTNNYTNNDRFPKTAFEYHPEKSEFSYWYGMDYNTGIYTRHPIFMDDRDAIETPHFRWEKYITEGYKNSGIIFPFILNLKFLFDDTPATPDSLRKYSMNRYYGFYADKLDYVGSITSYRTPLMVPNTYLVNNIIVSGDTGMTTDQYCKLDYYDIPSINPFYETWDDNKNYYVFIDNTNDFYRTETISELYPVQRVFQNNKYVYKIISDKILDNYWYSGYTNGTLYYNKTVDINFTGSHNILSGVTNDLFIDKYKDCDGNDKYMYGDLYLIRINNMFHVLKYSSGQTVQNELTINPITGDYDDYKYYIQTDYAINLNSSYIEYWILGKSSPYYVKLPVGTENNNPLTFPIYRVKFSDIKDFDFDRINTGFSDFDYEKTEYVNTNEEKLYAFNYNDPSIPPSKRVGNIGTSAQYKIDNISSEYIADDELYEVFDLGQQNSYVGNNNSQNKIYDLNDIWRKNQSNAKWGFMGSISHSDYPYKLNNNYEVGGPYNRTSDPFYTIPDVISKNMDYFYRLGNFYYANTGNTVYYKNQSTNIQYDFISGQIGNGFDIKAYFTLDFDYFTFFFKNKMYYEDNAKLYTKSYDKYSVFNFGDDNVPSVTLFKGLKFKINEVKNIYTENNLVTKVLLGSSNYNNYKFSIIFNENYEGVNTGLMNNDIGEFIDTTQNNINIILNEKFQNILIIINAKMTGSTTLNDVSVFDVKEGLYYGKKLDGTLIQNYNPSLFTASNFIHAINDYNGNYGLSVKYYWIKEPSVYGTFNFSPLNFNNSTMNNITGWNYLFQSFILSIETPVGMTVNNNCYTTYPFYVNSVQDDYVATLLTFNEQGTSQVPMFRFPGPYEPIFKDISLFKDGFFCYNNIHSEIIPTTAVTYSLASSCSEIPDYNIFFNGVPIGNKQWDNTSNIGNTTNYVDMNVPPLTYNPDYPITSSEPTVPTRYLSIRGFDFSIIPPDAIITGITMNLTRKAFTCDTNAQLIYAKEYEVFLSKNCYDKDQHSASRSKGSGDVTYYIWDTILRTVPYGGALDTWGDAPANNWVGDNLVGSDISNPLFGIIMRVAVVNSGTTSTILPQIQSAQIIVNYQWNKINYVADRTVYFDNNYKFETSLNDFGKIDEFIYSKVNEKSDILEKSPDVYHIYPSVDEFGYEYSDRFIFKSSWDKEFFTRTINRISQQSGIV